MPVGYTRVSQIHALLAALQYLLAPIICIALLLGAHQLISMTTGDEEVALGIIAGLLFYMFLRGQMSGDSGVFASGWMIVSRVVIAWVAVVGVLLLIGYAAKISHEFSRRALFIWFLTTPALVSGMLILFRQWLRSKMVKSGEARKVVIAGANDLSRKLARSIMTRPELGLTINGFFDDRGAERLGIEPEELLGRLTDLPEFVNRHRIDMIFIAIPLSHVQRTTDLLDRLRDTTASIYFVPDIFAFELIQAHIDELDGIPIVALCETPFHGWRALIKRASDVVMASIMLLVAAPIMVFLALGVKLTTPGTVIFKQRRYGLAGQEIIVYKFRTMTVSEDGDHVPQATKDDARITPFGQFLRRYSLDELPQLINVLQGRMSVVGPRPHPVALNEQYRSLINGYMVRHKVAPGITGLAQVNGCRGETSKFEDMKRRIDYDLEYLRGWSLSLDLKILVRTLTLWFRDEQAY